VNSLRAWAAAAGRATAVVVPIDHGMAVEAQAGTQTGRRRRVLTALICMNVLLAVWYFSWLLSPAQAGTHWVYGLLVGAELFNLVQAAGFWWTVLPRRPTPAPAPWAGDPPRVDVLIPTYNEPLDVVGPTVLAATRMTGAETSVYLLDDGDRLEMAELATRYGATYISREEHGGAKAGNINNALALTDSPFVAVFDCDHVPKPQFLTETVRYLVDPSVAFIQTPQYYANREAGAVAVAAAIQQDLFFGVIARGKQSKGAMFCCGTNFVFRRAALEQVGGFPENSLTEDFELSMQLHELGWESRYLSTVLAHGMGPEDMVSYVSQQARWAQGCLSAIPRIFRYRLPWRLRLQYLLSATYFLSGFTVLIYMSLPVFRIFAHVQPIHQNSVHDFLVHFAPYFCACVVTVSVASDGEYTFGAYTLAAANFGVQVRAFARVLTRRKGKFVVTPKHGTDGRQLRPIRPALLALTVLITSITYALVTSRAASVLTNVAFASIHVVILSAGCWSAVWRRRQPAATVVDLIEVPAAPASVLLDVAASVGVKAG
jgi:cellulose synthase (UDP-forming)